jgi:hypothetical protein
MAQQKNSLVANINRRKRAGKSRSKAETTVSKQAYTDMQAGWPAKRKAKTKAKGRTKTKAKGRAKTKAKGSTKTKRAAAKATRKKT